tara:strand:- start:451 stop:891 length:441 start_codon:yes stop_codon:yes gene_type:complete
MAKSKKIVESEESLEAFTDTLIAETTEALELAEVPEPEDIVEIVPELPKRFIANLYKEREPIEKDIFAGSYVFWDSTNQITWEALNPKYATDLELLSQGDILVAKEGQRYLVSRWETPKEWVQNLPWAILGERYICKDVIELYETE